MKTLSSIYVSNPEFENWSKNWLNASGSSAAWLLYGPVGTGKTSALMRLQEQERDKTVVYIDLKEFASDQEEALVNYIYTLVQRLRQQGLSAFPEFQVADYVYCNKNNRVPLFMQTREKLADRAEEVYGLVSDCISLDMLGTIGTGVKVARKAQHMYEVYQVQKKNPEQYKRLNLLSGNELKKEVAFAAMKDIEKSRDRNQSIVILLDHYEQEVGKNLALYELVKKSGPITWVISTRTDIAWVEREKRFEMKNFSSVQMESFWEQYRQISGHEADVEMKVRVENYCEGNPLLLGMVVNNLELLKEQEAKSADNRIHSYMEQMVERLSMEEQSMICQLAVLGQFNEQTFARFFPGRNLYLYENWLQNHFFTRQGDMYYVQYAFSAFLNMHYHRTEIMDYCREGALSYYMELLKARSGNAMDLMQRMERLGEYKACRSYYEKYVLGHMGLYEELDGLCHVKRVMERYPDTIFEQAPELYFKEGNYSLALRHLRRIYAQARDAGRDEALLEILPYCEIVFRILEVGSPNVQMHEASFREAMAVLERNRVYLPRGLYVRFLCITLVYYAKFLTGRRRKAESRACLEQAKTLLEDSELVRIYGLYKYKGMVYEKLGELEMDEDAYKSTEVLEESVQNYQYAIDSTQGWDSQLLLSAGLAHKRLVESYGRVREFERMEYHYLQASEIYDRVHVRNRSLIDYYVKTVYLNVDSMELIPIGYGSYTERAERNFAKARAAAEEGMLILEVECSTSADAKKQSRQLLNAYAKTNRLLAELRRRLDTERQNFAEINSLYLEGIAKAEEGKLITKDPPYAWLESYLIRYSMADFLEQYDFKEEAAVRRAEADRDKEDYEVMMGGK